MIEVTCAVIRNEEDEVLVVQRGKGTDHPYKWEFPGGKINTDESEEECIIREVGEELSIDIVICGILPVVEHDYGHKKIKLIPFVCDTLNEQPLLSEHISYKWLSQNDLMSVDFSEADVFVAQSYLDRFKDNSRPVEEIVKTPELPVINDYELQTMIYKMLSLKEVDWIATSAIENPAVFLKLFEYSHSDNTRLAFRSSWVLTKVCDKYPNLIYPYLSEIVELLPKLDNESALRSFLRIISLCEIEKINTSLHGFLADYCFELLRSTTSAIAVKVYSMEIIYKLSMIYRELVNELSVSISILMEDATAAIKSRGTTIMKKLAEIPINPGSSQQ